MPANITFAGDEFVKECSSDKYVEIAHAIGYRLGLTDGTGKPAEVKR